MRGTENVRRENLRDQGFNYSDSNSLRGRPDWRMIDCKVPMRISA
jgi:hypothetical protein